MIKIKQYQLKVSISEELGQSIHKELREKFSPYISTSKNGYWQNLGVEGGVGFPTISVDSDVIKTYYPKLSVLKGGEIFLQDNNVVFYFKIPVEDDYLEAGCIYPQDINIERFDDFLATIVNAVKNKLKIEINWEEINVHNDVFVQISQTMRSIVPTEPEIKAARELESIDASNVLRTIKDANSILLNELKEKLRDKVKDSQPIIDRFEELGLLNKDLVIFCKQTGQQINRVASRAALEDMSKIGLKCFLCGKSIIDERIDELVMCSDLGVKLIEKSYWMPVRVLDSLQSLGVKLEDCLLDFSESGEINIFINVNSDLVMFHLLDKEFNLSDVYMLCAKIDAYNTDTAVVVSTRKLPTVIKSYLRQSNENTTIKFIEAIRELNDDIKTIIEGKQKILISSIMEGFTALTPVNINEIILSKIGANGGKKELADAKKAKEKEPVMAGGKPKKK